MGQKLIHRPSITILVSLDHSHFLCSKEYAVLDGKLEVVPLFLFFLFFFYVDLHFFYVALFCYLIIFYLRY